jgi:hypothetical protein
MLNMNLPTAKQTNPWLIVVIIMLLLVSLFPISEEKKEVTIENPDNIISSMVLETGCYYEYRTTRTHHKKCKHDN